MGNGSGWSIDETHDFGFFITGVNTENQIIASKLDSLGNIEWSYNFEGTQAERSSGLETEDGNFMVIGGKDNVIKLDQNGNTIWANQLEYDNADSDASIEHIEQTDDFGFIICGAYQGNYSIIKLNSDGEVDWHQIYEPDYSGIALEIKQAGDKGYAFIANYGQSVEIVKIDSVGIFEWKYSLDTPSWDLWGGIIANDNGSFSYSFWTDGGSFGGGDIYLVNIDSDGNEVWYNEYGTSFYEWNRTLISTIDNGFALGGMAYGTTDSWGNPVQGFYILKTDSIGNEEWYSLNHPPFGHSEVFLNDFIQTTSLGFVMIGSQGNQIIVMKLDQNGNLRNDSFNEFLPKRFRLYQSYPNPFNPVTTLMYELPKESFVDITIYDMLGNVVSNLLNADQSSGYKSIQWNATNNQGEPVSAGVYLFKIQAGDFVDTKKMIFLK